MIVSCASQICITGALSQKPNQRSISMSCLKLLTLFSLATALHASALEAKSEHRQSKKTLVTKSNSHHSEPSDGRFYITKKDIGSSGFSITHPGEWVLAEDIAISSYSQTPAISICSSNVILNLDNKTLSSKVTQGNNGIGVFIKAGLGNITIENGTIKNFTRAGIYKEAGQAQPCSQMSKKTVRSAQSLPACSCPSAGLKIVNIQALCNGTQNVVDAGIDGMGGLVIFDGQDVQIIDSSFLENALTGAFVIDSTKITVVNSHFDDNISSYLLDEYTPYTSGALFYGIKNLHIQESTFNKNHSEHEAHGLRVQGENITIDSVQAHDTSASIDDPKFSSVQTAGNVSGISVVASNFITIKNSQVFGYTLSASQTPDSITDLYNINFGIDLSDSTSFDIEDCEVASGTSTNTSANPITFITSGIHVLGGHEGHIKNCEIFDNTSISSVDGSVLVTFGVNIEDSTDIETESSLSTNNLQTAPLPGTDFTSQVAGFRSSRNCYRIYFNDCTALNCIGNGTDAVFGFSTYNINVNDINSINIRFEGCRAELIRAFDTTKSAGFVMQKVSLCEISNCQSNDNITGILVTDASTVNNLIHNNNLANNVYFGIYDEALSPSNAYYANYAKNNGFPITDNYRDSGPNTIFPDAVCAACVPNGADKTPIRLWQLPTAPCTTNTNCLSGDNLDNLSIANG